MRRPGRGTAQLVDAATDSARARVLTPRFRLSASEWATTAIAAVVSSAGYLTAGYPYLARGVVGDLAGFLLLGVVGTAVGARLKHEALICLASIDLVLLLDPQWPLRLSEPIWWGWFAVGLGAYVAVRKKICS